MFNTELSTKQNAIVWGTGLVGNAVGIVVGIKRKSGFWGTVGWFLLGGMLGTGIGYMGASLMPEKKTTTASKNEEDSE